MADEANKSTFSNSQPESVSSGIMVDPDLRPIGRCYREARLVQAALNALRSAQESVRQTVRALGDCRAAARAEAGDYAAANSTSFEDAVEAAILEIAVNASIIEDIVKTACSDCREDSNE
jgi:hypothetical protein